jgi:hypothetical protein
MEDKKLSNAYMFLAAALREMAKRPIGTATKGHKKSGKTRRGARHTQGVPFKPRKLYSGTPAQYRHNHVGNPKAALIEKIKDSRWEAKWT